jgi:hypothetical protein
VVPPSPSRALCGDWRRLLGRRRPTRRRPGFHLRRRRAPTRYAHPSSSAPAVRNRALKPKLYVSGSEIWSNYKCSRHLLRLETSNFFEKIVGAGPSLLHLSSIKCTASGEVGRVTPQWPIRVWKPPRSLDGSHWSSGVYGASSVLRSECSLLTQVGFLTLQLAATDFIFVIHGSEELPFFFVTLINYRASESTYAGR